MSVRKAQTDFFSPMTGNVFRDNRRRADLIMEAAKVDVIKTDDPFTQIREKRSYAPQDDPASIADAFDREYGVLSDEEAAKILEENRKKIEEPTPVIDPDPIPTPTPDPEPSPEPENTPEKAVEKASGFSKSGRKAFMGNSKYKSPSRVANRNKAKAMAKARKASSSSSSSRSSTSSSAGRSGVGRGGARGGSTGGRGASSKGGVSRGSRSGSPSRGGARGGARGGSAGRGASSKGGTSRGGARTNRSRSRRRCDIRCKFDISLLFNMNLIRDDLAELAYFVKEISN